ncbi:hypothetical protein [Rubrobacter aplysinae]|uniref:hypothetical protein n=1 Tax=Rubrobacter aplysinae TaxID=909625 RepID=UPI00064C04CA|nr:hypothetical protein [Rubrobacter aplysinae]
MERGDERNESDLIPLQSALTAMDEAATSVREEVDRDRLSESSLSRLATVEAELRRSRVALEKIIREESG